MSRNRRFKVSFKREVIEELMCGGSNMSQIGRKHQLSTGLVSLWRDQYLEGKFDDAEGNDVKALQHRVRELERMVGRLTLDNGILKKALGYAARKRGSSLLPPTVASSGESDGGAN